jgi:RimJ/RimL family protein N-acetyltransferase
MKLQEVTIDELTPIIKIASESNDFNNSNDSQQTILETLTSFSISKDFHIFGFYTDSNKLIGFISTFPNKTKGRISIGYAFIIQSERGKGYGYLMRESLVEWIKQKGFREIYAKTWKGNTAMVHLNEKMKFKLVEEVINDRTDGDSTLKYILSL